MSDATRNSDAAPAEEQRLWRSLPVLNESDWDAQAEFQEGVEEWPDAAGRRRFLKLMGASLALAGAGACTSPPDERILPYVHEPERVVPGKPLFFATAFPFRGYAQGLLVESHAGRPTKVEGNPQHPSSLGATSVWGQASVLDLYDPNRSRTIQHMGQLAAEEQFLRELGEEEIPRLQQTGGRGFRILTDTFTSPTLGLHIEALIEAYPEARWYRHDPISSENVRTGLRNVLGRFRTPVYRFDEAEVILSIDSDFLYSLPGSLRYARDFVSGRRVRRGQQAMNRLFTVESTPTITGAMADHRLPLPPSRVQSVVQALARRLGVQTEGTEAFEYDAWLEAAATDLVEHSGRALVVGGESLPPEAHGLIHRINVALGAVGNTLYYIDSPEQGLEVSEPSLETLTQEMMSGAVDTLLILSDNPVYTAPGNVPFEEAMPRVRNTVHLSIGMNETAARAVWHLPKTHYLESWSDAHAHDGTPTIMQPLIAPLYDACRSPVEVVLLFMGRPGGTAYEAVRGHWQARANAPDRFEDLWQRALYEGVVPEELRTSPAATGTAPGRAAGVPPAEGAAGLAAAEGVEGRPPVAAGDAHTLEVLFRPDPTLWDGSFADNAWLQELPKPMTKLVWDNAVLLSPATGDMLGVRNEQVVQLELEERTIEGAVWLTPGHADGCATVWLGHGRRLAGDVGRGVGFDAYRLRSSRNEWLAAGVKVRPLNDASALVTTQHHFSMEGRELAVMAKIDQFRTNPDWLHEGHPEELPSLYPEYEYPDYKWGMVIDLGSCIGCSACVVACQSENNIPVVGKEEVRRGREMHWLRVDRYYEGPMENPDAVFQPVPCMHCEKAPCEVVCPVYATVHDSEGLNVMVYQRCIGTRDCSNNCPYKVRRFNFLEYADWETGALKLQRNPDVTVRSRGVMEKCSYCIQRISAARIEAKREDREIRTDEVQTACQMACPTNAILFGDLNDDTARVTQAAQEPHNYALLGELGVRPRTTYLARLTNPGPNVPETMTSGTRIGQEEKLKIEVGGPPPESR